MMALLGMGANVQCNGTVPGYHSTRDLIFSTEGSTRTSSNNNIGIQNDRFNNGGSLPVSSLVLHSEYDKELVKRTILKHEAMLKEQIHELHRLYNRQKELMDEVKKSFDRHSSLGTSWSSSFPSHLSSKTPNLPWSSGQSSAIVAESIQMSLGSGKENSRQIYPAPPLFPTEGCSKDFKLSHSENRQAGNKLLDLHLPADEYIDSEKAKPSEDELVSKLPRVSAYTLEGVSQAVCNSDKRPYGANFNGFSNLNGPFEHMKEAAVKSDDLTVPTSHRKGPFHDLSMRGELCFHNMSNDVFWNPYKRQEHEVCAVNQPSEKKNQEHLSYMISADEINQGQRRERKFSGGEGSVGTTKGPRSATLLGPSSYPYQLVPGPDLISSRIPPQVLLFKTPGSSPFENQTAVQVPPHFSTSALFDQRSKPLTGLSEITGDELYRCRNIKSDVHMDHQNFLQSSFCGGSKTSDAPSFIINNLNNVANQSSATGHELRKHVKDSEDVETSNNINLNVMPANNSETAAFQNVKEDLLPRGKPCGENKISTQMESFLSRPCDSGITHGFELMTAGARDCSRKKIHASLEQHFFHASTSTVCQNQNKKERIEEIEKGCVSDIELPRNHVPGLDQMTAGENLKKNDQERELKCGAGIIDLNIPMNEGENLPVDIDFQAPVSPENKESSPPRGESDENQLEMSYQLAGQGCSELQLEEARLAAEALVSISESVAHSGLQMLTCPESFTSGPLHWFARIASSVTDHAGNGVKADFIGNTSDHEEFLSAGIDYFEAMTLKLTETKSQDCCGKSSGQKEEEGGSTSPTRPRKGWTCKGKRQKDFQSEILPSLTSLSRYEVTEDLQIIGGLMEAAGAHTGRNALARGRRRSSTSVSNNTHLLKQQLNSGVKLGIEKRGLISWGKANLKPRGKRYPARNPQVFWSQVFYI